MTGRSPLPIALTMGEPGGIGPEIAVKAHAALAADGPAFFFVGDGATAERAGAVVIAISTPAEASSAFRRGLPVLDIGVRARIAPGRADPSSASAVLGAIERAVALALAGEAGAVVTNPIQKASLAEAGFKFPGHTEYLESLTASAPMRAGRGRGAVMMIAGPELRTVPVTIHTSVRDAAASLTTTMIIDKATIVLEALKFDFGILKPRLAVSGLNPHAGEQGTIGVEDRDIIAPAVAELRKVHGDAVFGPVSADAMFHAEARQRYDAALCMLHDQALIPAKTLAFDRAVNVTLGLPIVRTSPDHGTALDIAGKGKADARSLIEAIRLAARIAEARAAAR